MSAMFHVKRRRSAGAARLTASTSPRRRARVDSIRWSRRSPGHFAGEQFDRRCSTCFTWNKDTVRGAVFHVEHRAPAPSDVVRWRPPALHASAADAQPLMIPTRSDIGCTASPGRRARPASHPSQQPRSPALRHLLRRGERVPDERAEPIDVRRWSGMRSSDDAVLGRRAGASPQHGSDASSAPFGSLRPAGRRRGRPAGPRRQLWPTTPPQIPVPARAKRRPACPPRTDAARDVPCPGSLRSRGRALAAATAAWTDRETRQHLDRESRAARQAPGCK
jgi:hypothetical protein